MHNSLNFADSLSRRAFLRGVGVTMALPWLESAAVWGATSTASPSSQPPLRLAVIFAGNGFHSREWSAKGEGRNMQLGKVLLPLKNFREKLIFIRGLHNAEADGSKGAHPAQTGNLLTGTPLHSGGAVRSGISMDQLAAQKIGQQTKVPSLALGCEPSIAAMHEGYSMLYSSHISWSSPTTPTPLELYPALAFDSLFLEEAHQSNISSVLDAVLEDAQNVNRHLSYLDRHKLDEYLSSVREVEKRIENAGKRGRLQGWRPTLDKPNLPRPAKGIPQDIDQHMRLMCDIMTLAFQTDTTRICTLKLNNDHSTLLFPKLEVEQVTHHKVSHADSEDTIKINQFFTRQVAYIAEKLNKVQEGERTALDNTMILYLSSMRTGNHDSSHLPVVLLGSAGGQIQTGRVLDYLNKPNRKMCSLYLSMLSKMGIHLNRFGDSKQRLAEI
jgi:Protein of unknown function (DUF1552)